MKTIAYLSLILVTVLMLIACNEEPDYQTEIQKPADDAKILIAYFSWADNVEEFNLDELHVDSYTGASLSVPGNGEIVAEFIHQEVGGTMHKILVEEPYSPVYDECLDRARDELAQNNRPALKSTIEDFDSYDYIFLGFPNWWNQAPRAVLTFLDSYNFENKTVIPFCMHGTSGKNNPVNEVANYLPSSTTVMTSLGVYRPETTSSAGAVVEWLEKMGFISNETQA